MFFRISFVMVWIGVITADLTGEEPVNFSTQIRPLLASRCIACHGGVEQAGDVSFVYKNQVLPPGGDVVQPGDPEGSSIMERITSDDPDLRMPPPDHGEALSKEEVELFRTWIEQGAPRTDHWAYEPPVASTPPEIENSAWCLQPIDPFVLRRLESRKWLPAKPEDPARWLRRVTFDLTGLPPTPNERAEFLQAVKQSSDTAYESVVDQLLERPAFGERWASVWLDQIRYADSRGLGADGRRNVWRFRDWVVQALNDDMPFDEFTIKQIAGDLLPSATFDDQIATAAHRVTQSNEEGGTDDEEFRIAAVLDRVNTTWQTWQGVTFGCAQCHHHPYDPFQHTEFYRFAAFFNNTADCDLNNDWPLLQVPLDRKDYARATALDQKIDSLRNEIWQRESAPLLATESWTPLLGLSAKTNNATQVNVETNGERDEFFTVDTVSQNTDFTLEAPLPNGMKSLSAIRLTAMPHDPEVARRDSEWGFVLSHLEASLIIPGAKEKTPLKIARLVIDEPDPYYNPQDSLNAKTNRGFAAYTQIHYPRQAALVLEAPQEVPAGTRLQVVLKHRIFILASFSLVTRRGHLAVSDDPVWQQLLSDQELQAKRGQLEANEKERGAIRSTSVPVMRERLPQFARQQHVFERGLFLTKGEQVAPGTPESLPPLPPGATADRLAMAKWLVSDQNPLTARVEVNRIWARIFGVGLVASEEDFGSSGELPTHPQLLDDLAVRFRDQYGWSRKTLIRELVLSATYRQASKQQVDQSEQDPQNRWLARGPRVRLTAEMVRDQALAVSGLLTRKIGGPPVHPPIPGGVWTPFSGGDKWSTPDPDNPDRYRRSLYTYTKRSIPFPMFAAFDQPSREFCAPRRLTSNTPLQALMTLNDVTFQECAVALAAQMRDAPGDLTQQIASGFLRVTCREPKETELQVLVELHRQAPQEMAMQSVAMVLLNLDEIMTR